MEKDPPLKVLLITWQHRFGENTLLVHLAEQHFQALELISVNDVNLRAYVYTFAQPPDCYGVDLKYPLAMHNIIGGHEQQTLEQVLAILQTHFLNF